MAVIKQNEFFYSSHYDLFKNSLCYILHFSISCNFFPVDLQLRPHIHKWCCMLDDKVAVIKNMDIACTL